MNTNCVKKLQKNFFLYFRHALIVFGGVQGLETSLETDENLAVDDPSLLFQHYVNTCPHQGSRTITTAVLLITNKNTLF